MKVYISLQVDAGRWYWDMDGKQPHYAWGFFPISYSLDECIENICDQMNYKLSKPRSVSSWHYCQVVNHAN